ncbi:MAG: GntR family transcriptional regulator [Erysipelotrichaceae bacterium]|nr:GntR family transcriptional regulator [Erysipelotrichaceae bacterium]MBQ1740959.1 GntR family transcriptional regulator [Erysipelotrichaceae bacterium]MBQ1776387.1 GntR family transcriptional regulator [Erysipelotrichaceae bacterium]MBQ3994068.1 GntR family transcriptional regulator [Erysipelotrichaceae bacterium]MBQ5553431.1 GntR family transcriptional regulator [Erysipelotrichaceae bacterium]
MTMILNFDFHSDVPIFMQIRNQIVIGIAEGKLKPGEQLPTIRALADESGINMMTVSKAYQILKQEGYITTDRRSGARVALKDDKAVNEKTMQQLRLAISELRLSGMKEEEILSLVSGIYQEGDLK